MMPLRFFTTLLLVSLYATLSFCQRGATSDEDFEVIWGEEFQIPKGQLDKGYVGSLGLGLMQISLSYKKHMKLQSFGENLRLKKAQSIDLSGFPKDMHSEGVHKIGPTYYWFYSFWNKKKKKELLYAQAVNPATASLEGSAIKVNECSKITPESYFSKKYYNFFSGRKYNKIKSYDENHIMISYRGHPEFRNDAKNIDRIGFLVLDSALNKVSGSELTMPYTEEKMDNIDFEVDGKGNAYYLIRVYDGPRKEKKKDGSLNYHFEILRIPVGSNTIEIRPLALDKPYVRNITILDDVNGNLSCYGFYSNDPKEIGTDGFFIAKLDSNGSFIGEQTVYVAMPEEMLSQLESSRQKRRPGICIEDHPEWSKLRLRNVLINEDGSHIVAGEEYYTYTTTHTRKRFDSYITYDIKHHVYNDMVVMKIDAERTIVWWHRIPKTQYGKKGRGGLSFSLFASNNSIYMFYLDNEQNNNRKLDQIPAIHMDGMGGILTYAKIDEEGVLTRKQMFDLRVKNVEIKPNNIHAIGNNLFVTRSYLKRAYKFIVFKGK